MKHLVVRRDQPVGGPLEQDAATESRGRLAGGGRDEPVEVESRDVQPRGQLLAARLVVVERHRQQVDEAGEGVGRRAHAADLGSGRPALRLIALADLRDARRRPAGEP